VCVCLRVCLRVCVLVLVRVRVRVRVCKRFPHFIFQHLFLFSLFKYFILNCHFPKAQAIYHWNVIYAARSKHKGGGGGLELIILDSRNCSLVNIDCREVCVSADRNPQLASPVARQRYLSSRLRTKLDLQYLANSCLGSCTAKRW
jgi:hypothetical protein